MICEYGCGQEALYQFKNGRWCCSKNHASCATIRKIISIAGLGKNRKPKTEEHKKRIRETVKETFKNLDKKIEHSKIMKQIANRPDIKKKNRERMLSGKAAYMNSHVRNPSKDGARFRKLVNEAYPTAIPEFKILNYSVDGAVQEYKIALEYDGWYHFNCQESVDYDNKRQKEIEDLGWKFIRYNIFQPFPTKEQIKQDIDSIIKGDNKIDVTTNRKDVCPYTALRPTIDDQR